MQHGLDRITAYQRFDDGGAGADGDGEASAAGGAEAVPTDWPHHIDTCWCRHTCHTGAVKALKALAEVPPERRTPAMRATIDAGAEYLLRHHIFKRSHDLSKVSKPGWKRFGFPLMYQTDVLEILWILARLDSAYLRDERAREALDLVAAKADAEGRWKLADHGRPPCRPHRGQASTAAGCRCARSRCWTGRTDPPERPRPLTPPTSRPAGLTASPSASSATVGVRHRTVSRTAVSPRWKLPARSTARRATR